MHEVKRWRDDGTNRSREALSVEGVDVLREGHHALGIVTYVIFLPNTERSRISIVDTTK